MVKEYFFNSAWIGKQLAEKSSQNIIEIAENALKIQDSLEKVLIILRPPRKDNNALRELTSYSNSVFEIFTKKSQYKTKIVIRSMDMLESAGKHIFNQDKKLQY